MAKQDKFEKRHIEKMRHKVGKTIGKFNLIENGDKILIGISGGKDSLILTEILAERRKYIPIDYELHAVHVKVKDMPYEINIDFLNSFCQNLGVNFIYKEVAYEEQRKDHRSPCYFCAWTRRKIFFNLSEKLNCNKLATGHHLDDALQTMLMNMVYHSSISSIPESVSMFEGRLQFIRPLIECFENDLISYASIQAYPKLKTECPYDQKTNRHAVKQIIEEISLLNPSAKLNMFNAMSNIYNDYLPTGKKKKQ